MRFLLLIFFVFYALPACADSGAKECVLKNKQFCGTWKGSPAWAGDSFTILGDRMEYEDGGYFDCTILDEQTRAGEYIKSPRSTILQCKGHFKDLPNDKPFQGFYRLTSFYEDYGDQCFDRIFIEYAEHLSCLFTQWEAMTIPDAHEIYGCGPGSTAPYSREVPCRRQEAD